MMRTLLSLRTVISVVALSLLVGKVIAGDAKVVSLMQKELKAFDGKIAQMLTVEYGPGVSSRKHRHNAHIFVYVLEGAVVMQVEGGEETVLEAGDTFYESPEDIHLVSKNASNTETAKFLVFTLKDQHTPVSISMP